MTSRRRLIAAVVVVVALGGCTAGPSVEERAPDTTIAPPVSGATTSEPAAVEGAAGSPGIGDRLYPELGNGGYDVVSYRFELSFDDDLSTVDGVAEVVIEPTEALASLNLDLQGMQVSSVTVDGVAAGFSHAGGELVIESDTVLVPGATSVVSVVYAGSPGNVGGTSQAFDAGWQESEDGGYLFSEPNGASRLFPVNDHPLDRAPVELEVTVRDGLEVVSGGRAEMVSAAGRSTFTFLLEPLAPYLIPLAVGVFDTVDEPWGTMEITTWFPPAATEGILFPFRQQTEMLDFLVDRFGPYPFDTLGSVVVDDDLGAALETQTLPTYTLRSLNFGEEVVLHEFAHQWFGNWITVGQWDDIWLNEGWATFIQWLWAEESEGTAAYDARVASAHSAMAAAARGDTNFVPPDHPEADDLFTPSIYLRGGLVLVALRDHLGDDQFEEFVAAYLGRFGGGAVTTETFLELVGEFDTTAVPVLTRHLDDQMVPPMPERGL